MSESFSKRLRRARATGVVLWTLLLGLALLAADAAAKRTPDEEFQLHYDQAMTMYESRQYEAAAREFQTAYAIKQLPRLILNLGQVYRKMGRAKEALGYYELYLRLEPNPKPELKTELEGYINQLRSMISAAERAKTEVDNAQRTPDPAIGSPAVPPPAGDPPPAATPAPSPTPVTAQTPAPAPPATAPAVVPPVSAAPVAARQEGVRRRWPIWVGVGAAILVVGAVATGVGVALAHKDDSFWTARPLP